MRPRLRGDRLRTEHHFTQAQKGQAQSWYQFASGSSGLTYAFVFGANDQMWIPIEAISAVYPETQAAFLAIAGDEIEAYGWDNPPASFNLRRTREENKLF